MSKPKEIVELEKIYGITLNENKPYQYGGNTYVVNEDGDVTHLNLSGNQLTEIKGLETLVNLQGLWLYNNRLTEIKGLKSVITSLKELHINNNPFIQEAGLMLKEGTNHRDDIRHYLSIIEQESVMLPAKVIFGGNHAAGKSSFLYYLKQGELPEASDNTHKCTHILNIEKYYNAEEPKQLAAMIYDFGGKDYYHGLYQAFFSANSVNLLFWCNETNRNETGKTDCAGLLTRNYTREYWLHQLSYAFTKLLKRNNISISQDTKESIIMIQTHADTYKYEVFREDISKLAIAVTNNLKNRLRKFAETFVALVRELDWSTGIDYTNFYAQFSNKEFLEVVPKALMSNIFSTKPSGQDYKPANLAEEVGVVERMLGKKVADSIKISNSRIKPGKNSSIIVSQGTKPGEFAEVYDVTSVLFGGDPLLVNGALTKAGIVLWSGAEEGSAYHEAFHNVEYLYLNKKQRDRLYNEIRKEKGRGKYSDEQASDLMAERFKRMVLDKESAKIQKGDTLIDRVVRSMYRFMGWFMNLIRVSPVFRNQKALFNAIYNGHFRYNKANSEALNTLPDNIFSVRFADKDFKYIGSSSALNEIIRTLGDSAMAMADQEKSLYSSQLVLLVNRSLLALKNKNNPYLSEAERIRAINTAIEVSMNLPWFSEQVNNYTSRKYNMDLVDDIGDKYDNIIDAYDDAGGMSLDEVITLSKSHGVDSTKVDLSKTAARLTAAIINSLPQSTEINPDTGLPKLEPAHRVWYEIPDKLRDCTTVEEMMSKVDALSKDPKYQRHFKDGRVDPVNFWAALGSRLNGMNGHQQLLFLNNVRVAKQEYFKVSERGFGEKKKAIKEYEPYRELNIIRDSWAASFIKDGTITRDSLEAIFGNREKKIPGYIGEIAGLLALTRENRFRVPISI
jgi:hypothetical protein